jgi:hypothetical protein
MRHAYCSYTAQPNTPETDKLPEVPCIVDVKLVCTGDKIEVSGGGTYCLPKVHMLVQVSSNLFTLIALSGGNRICDPFPCKYGTRLRSNAKYPDTEIYGSFTLEDLRNAIASQSHDVEHIGMRDCDSWQYKVIERFCQPCVFERLARLWNEKESFL